MSLFKIEALTEMGYTEEEFDNKAAKITVKGYRLTYEEKQNLMFEVAMGWTDNTQEALEKSLLSERKFKADFEQDMKNLKKMSRDAENYAVKVIGWNRKDFKETYDMFEILKGNMETALDYWEAYGEKAGEYYLRTYV